MKRSNRELAYLYDLYVAPTWRDCFDRLFNEKLGLPAEGRVLDVNCGTGGHAIEMASALATKGDVTAIDECGEMIALARAKVTVAKIDNIDFSVASGDALAFPNNSFDLAVCDASFLPPTRLPAQIKELKRVAKPGAMVAIYLATRGSFDEFFSIFWEALYDCHLADELLAPLEGLIKERPTVSDCEDILSGAGLSIKETFQKKEEFLYENAEQFLTAPLIENYMLDGWLAILPPKSIEPVREALARIIDRERAGYNFDVSIKATMFTAEK